MVAGYVAYSVDFSMFNVAWLQKAMTTHCIDLPKEPSGLHLARQLLLVLKRYQKDHHMATLSQAAIKTSNMALCRVVPYRKDPAREHQTGISGIPALSKMLEDRQLVALPEKIEDTIPRYLETRSSRRLITETDLKELQYQTI